MSSPEEKKFFLRLSALPALSAELFSASIDWMDDQWDEKSGFLSYNWPGIFDEPAAPYLSVRETAWYGLGLFIRDINNDRDKAIKAFGNVMGEQLDEPGKIYHGTFLRSPTEPKPGPNAVEWVDYDPNWREFIGTTMAIMLASYEKQLPRDFIAKLDHSIKLAVEGSLARNLKPNYSNIAVMHAFLLVYAGTRMNKPEWVKAGEDFASEVYALFKRHDAFDEYNSPTYYAVDLFGLGLWRAYSPSEKLRVWGMAIEQTFWNDIAEYYHAGMRNMCGPYDRSYGMDMRKYAGNLGMAIWMLVGRELAPFPDTRKPFDHSHDLSFAPLMVAVGVNAPDSILPGLKKFMVERQVEHVLPDNRKASAWISEEVMIGGETGWKKDSDQAHMGTVHWKIGGDIGFLRTRSYGPIDVRAEKMKLRISLPRSEGPGPAAFEFIIYAPGVNEKEMDHEHWPLPGLLVRIESNLSLSPPEKNGEFLHVWCTAPPSDSEGVVVLSLSRTSPPKDATA